MDVTICVILTWRYKEPKKEFYNNFHKVWKKNLPKNQFWISVVTKSCREGDAILFQTEVWID